MADTRYGGPLCIATTNVYKHQLAPHQARLSGIYVCQISAIMMTTMQSEILNCVMRKKETKTIQTNQYAIPKWPTKCYHSVFVESLRLLSYRKKNTRNPQNHRPLHHQTTVYTTVDQSTILTHARVQTLNGIFIVVVDSEIRPPCAKFQLCYKSST